MPASRKGAWTIFRLPTIAPAFSRRVGNSFARRSQGKYFQAASNAGENIEAA
ncbi:MULTISPECIES: hypothetical protein [Kingella]|uniref:Uncharacterized protein n=1 Tax=Kingella bonacorsii TaxID=2796361 RepID=A0ABS1BQS6_9NEIS|nr:MULTISPECIES: hypothetical protein [Kingella]MBK0395629.1 hypothetical protein [Kingella bonacorsii]